MPPRSAMTQQSIFQTALRVVDAEGLPALSIRRLGQELGVEGMALYRHVANKQAILDGMVEAALEELNEIATTEPHDADVLLMFRSLRRLFQRHPNLLPLLAGRPFGSAAGRRLAEATLSQMCHEGVTTDAALHRFDALLGFTVGYAWLEARGFVGEIPETAPLVRTNVREMSGAGPLVPELPVYPPEWDHELDFEAGLGMILTGRS